MILYYIAVKSELLGLTQLCSPNSLRFPLCWSPPHRPRARKTVRVPASRPAGRPAGRPASHRKGTNGVTAKFIFLTEGLFGYSR